MTMKVHFRIILVVTLFSVTLLSACIPEGLFVHSFYVKNCTRDTLVFGGSIHNCIDSIPHFFYMYMSETENYMKLKNCDALGMEGDPIPPDSIGRIPRGFLFEHEPSSKGYLFVIKLDDVRKYTWKHIRKKRLYDVLVVTEEWAKSNDYLIEYKGQHAK